VTSNPQVIGSDPQFLVCRPSAKGLQILRMVSVIAMFQQQGTGFTSLSQSSASRMVKNLKRIEKTWFPVS
jgi:hypothetical protein